MTFYFIASAFLVIAVSVVLFRSLPIGRLRNVNTGSSVQQGSDRDASLAEAVLTDTQVEQNIRLFHEQKAELDTQRDKGLLNEEAYAEFLTEAQRRLLTDTATKLPASPTTPANQNVSPSSNNQNGRWLLITFAVGVTLAAIALYEQLGAIDDVEIHQLLRAVQNAEGGSWTTGSGEQLHKALRKRTVENPDKPDYWLLLARVEQARGNLDATAKAYQGALLINPDDAEIHAELAQVFFALAGDRIDDAVLEHTGKALKLDPGNPSALGIAGIAAFSLRDYSEAARHWQNALQRLSPQSNDAQALRAGLQQARTLMAKNAGEEGASWSMRLEVSLPAEFKAPPDALVFIYLREWQGRPMPLVAQRLQVADLPATIHFSDAMALSPERKPSAMQQIEAVARIAISGQLQGKSGDLEGRSGPLDTTKIKQPLTLRINQYLP